MVETAGRRTHGQRTRGRDGLLVTRVAGGLLVVLGTANVALAALAAFTATIRLSGGIAGVLGLLGVVTVALGVLVARGSRRALVTSVVVFGGLFVLQAFAASGGGVAAPALVTLAVVLVPLVLALRATRPG